MLKRRNHPIQLFSLIVVLFVLYSPTMALSKDLLKKKTQPPTQFMIYFQPLFEFSENEAKEYISNLHEILSQNDSIQFEKLLIAPRVHCQRQKLKSCHPTLYFNKLCVPEKERASQFCGKKIKTDKDFFKEPVFNRIDWNKIALSINQFCNQKFTPVCQSLSRLHDQTMKKYKDLLKMRKNKKEEN